MKDKKHKEKTSSRASLTKDSMFLEQNVKHLEPILSSIREAVIIIDKNGKILLANPATELITGTLPTDLVGKRVQEAIAFECDKVNSAWFLSEALSGSRVVKLPDGCSVTQRGSKKIPVMAIGAPLYSPTGEYEGVVLTIRDLVEEVRAKAREYEFLSYISHQVRQPLTLFRWSLEAIFREKEKLDPKHEELLRELYHSTNRFKGFINDLIDISRLQVGKTTFNLIKIDIRAAVEEVVKETKQVAITHNVTLTLFSKAPAGRSLFILGDHDRLHDIFLNLITNAIFYNRPQGTVTVDAHFEDRETLLRLAQKSKGGETVAEYFQSMPTPDGSQKPFLLISISDTGLGIPETQQHSAFESFFRGDNVVEKGISGTGLGLFIVKSIVERLHGKIFFQSKENIGTTFYIVFPAI